MQGCKQGGSELEASVLSQEESGKVMRGEEEFYVTYERHEARCMRLMSTSHDKDRKSFRRFF